MLTTQKMARFLPNPEDVEEIRRYAFAIVSKLNEDGLVSDVPAMLDGWLNDLLVRLHREYLATYPRSFVFANESGETSLLRACRNGHVDVIKLLLVLGAEIDRADEGGVTPLLIACENGRVDVVRLLLNKGADVDRATKNCVTPLYVACENGHLRPARQCSRRPSRRTRRSSGG